jgi:outer membrane protein OmpA-like peptidoglycan-associated protein
MKKSYNLFIVILFFTGTSKLLSSCSLFNYSGYTDPIEVLYFKDNYKVRNGDSVRINWIFKNADSVYLSDLGVTLTGNDSIWIFPKSSNEYSVKAFNKNYDYKTSFTITLLNPLSGKTHKPIETGGDKPVIDFTQPSIELTPFLNGMLHKNIRHNFDKLKISEYFLKDNLLTFNVLLLDEFGNFISDYKAQDLPIEANIINENEKLKTSLSYLGEKEFENKEPIHAYFLVENSLAAFNLQKVFEEVRESIQNYDNNDDISIYLYNQNISKIIENAKPGEAFLSINPIAITSSGINASSSSLIEVLSKIIDNDHKQKGKNIVILVSFSGDNSSITTNLTDVAKIANTNYIPIYTLGIGSDIKTYQLNPLSQSTGAKMYLIDNSDVSSISNVLNEIYFSHKIGYQFELRINQIPKYSQFLNFHVSLPTSNGFLNDSTKIYLKTPEIYVPYQIISLFNYSSDVVKDEYLSKIQELADVLKDNPNTAVELIGYSNYEMNGDEEDIEMSLKRAKAVKDLLIKFGVSENQIKTRGKGNNNPLYFMPTKEWQLMYNRRAEIRWLDPSLLPYEITAEIAESEDAALKFVDNWTSRGFRSYFERRVFKDEIKYAVKIWGFATETEALNAVKDLQFIKPEVNFKLE